MTAAIARSKAFDAMCRLGPMIEAAAPIDQFTLARCQREANESLQADPVAAYTVLGWVAALKWQAPAVHDYFAQALAQLDIAAVRVNYGTALRLIGQNTLAEQQFRQASEQEPGNFAALRRLIRFNTFIGQFEAAQALCATLETRANRLFPENLQVADVNQILQHHHLNQAYTARCHEHMFAFLLERKLRPHSYSLKADLQDNIVFFKVQLDLPFEEVYQLDNELADDLIRNLPEFDSAGYWLGLECLQQGSAPDEYSAL